MSSIFEKDLLTRRELSIITRVDEKVIDELVQAGYLSRNGYDDDNNELFLNDTNTFFNAYRQYQIDMGLINDISQEDDDYDEILDLSFEYQQQNDNVDEQIEENITQTENTEIFEDIINESTDKRANKSKQLNSRRFHEYTENPDGDPTILQDSAFSDRVGSEQNSDSNIPQDSVFSDKINSMEQATQEHRENEQLIHSNSYSDNLTQRKLVEEFNHREQERKKNEDIYSVAKLEQKNNNDNVFKLDTVFHAEKSSASADSGSTPLSNDKLTKMETVPINHDTDDDKKVLQHQNASEDKSVTHPYTVGKSQQSLLEQYNRNRSLSEKDSKNKKEIYSFAENQSSRQKKDDKKVFHLDSVFRSDKGSGASASSPMSNDKLTAMETAPINQDFTPNEKLSNQQAKDDASQGLLERYHQNRSINADEKKYKEKLSNQQAKDDASQSLLERYRQNRSISADEKKHKKNIYSFAENQQTQLKKEDKNAFHFDTVFHYDKTNRNPSFDGENSFHEKETENNYEIRKKTKKEQLLCDEVNALEKQKASMASSGQRRKVFIIGSGQNVGKASENFVNKESKQYSYYTLPKKKYNVQPLGMSIRNTSYAGDEKPELMRGRIRTNRLSTDKVLLDAIGLGTLKNGINGSEFGSGLRQVYVYSAPLLSMLAASGYKKIYLDKMDKLKKLDVSRVESIFNKNRVFITQEEIKNKCIKISFNNPYSLRHNLIACDRYFMQRGLGRVSHLSVYKLKILLKNKALNAEDIMVLQFLIKMAPTRDAWRLSERSRTGRSFKNMFRMLFRGCDAIDGMLLTSNVYKASKAVLKVVFRTAKGLTKLGARATLLAGKAVYKTGKFVHNTKTATAFRYMADQTFIYVAPKTNARLKTVSRSVGTNAQKLKNVTQKVGANIKIKRMEKLTHGRKTIKGRIKNKFTGVFRRSKIGRIIVKPFKIFKIPGYIGKLISGAAALAGFVSVFMFILFCVVVLIMAIVDSMNSFGDMITVAIDGEDIQMSPAEYGKDIVERLNAEWEDGALDYNYVEADEPIMGLADEEIIEATKVILGLPENRASLEESNMKSIISIALAVYNSNITTENIAYYEETITSLWSITHSMDPDDATYSDVYECDNPTKNCGVAIEDTDKYKCNGHIDKTVKATIIADFDKVMDAATESAGITLTEEQKKSAKEYAQLDWESLYGINTSGSSEAFGTVFTESEISTQMTTCLNAWKVAKDDTSYTISPERQLVIKTAFGSVGKIPYYWGGAYSKPGYEGNDFGSTVSKSDYRGRNKKGLDCSHFTSWVYDTAASLNTSDSLNAHFGNGINTASLVSAARDDSYKIGSSAYKCVLKSATDRKNIQPGDMWVKLKTASGGDGSSHAMIILYPADVSANTYVVAECSGKGTKISTKKIGYGGGTHYILNFMGD